MTNPSESTTVFTIGHSTHPIEEFIALLRRRHIDAVADVRSRPYSRFNPQFNREKLAAFLQADGIDYMYLGRELGGRPEDPECYENGKVNYRRVAATPLFRRGLEQVRAKSRSMNIALMCAEKDPAHCHRTHPVARELAGAGHMIAHILADGELATHEAVTGRDAPPEPDLFGPPDDNPGA